MKTKFLRSLLCVVLAMGMIFSIGCGGEESEEEKISGTYFYENRSVVFTLSSSREYGGIMERIYNFNTDSKFSSSFDVKDNVIYSNSTVCGIVLSSKKIALRTFTSSYGQWTGDFNGIIPDGKTFDATIIYDNYEKYIFKKDGHAERIVTLPSGKIYAHHIGSYERNGNFINMNLTDTLTSDTSSFNIMVVENTAYNFLIYEKL